jgi:putative phage-type endonuclease
MDNLVNELLKSYPDYSRYAICDWYKCEYILTLKPVVSYLRKSIVDSGKYGVSLEQFYSYLEQRLTNGFYKNVKSVETRLASMPQHEQRSPEWFAFREGLITGSEAGYLLGVTGASSAINAFRGKSRLPSSKPNSSSPAIQHGVNYENVAKRIYELRYRVEVLELGCVPSATSYIGASPDGIVFKVASHLSAASSDSFLRYGRMLEIKCPYSRFIDDTIKPEYEVQMLQQQYTCQLPICDFLECGIIDTDHAGIPNIVNYVNLDDMLADTFDPTNTEGFKIENANIPVGNLSAEGMEKGVMIVSYVPTGTLNEFGKKEYKPVQYLYPLEKPYVRSEIMSWIMDIQKTCATAEHGDFIIKSWKVYKFSVKVKIYDQKKYESELIPQLGAIWSNILKFRSMEESERMFNAGKLKTIDSIKIPFDASNQVFTATPAQIIKSVSPKRTTSSSGKGTVRRNGKAALAAEANMQLIDSILENINLESL